MNSDSHSDALDCLSSTFRDAWSRGTPISIEDCLESIQEAEHAHLALGRLIAIEIDLRSDEATPPNREEYLSRFPQHVETVHQVFDHRANTIVSSTTLRTEPPGNDDTIESGVDSESVASSNRTISLPSETAERQNSNKISPGKLFGKYIICQRLGSGGMGEVWLARDDVLEINIALKFPRWNYRVKEAQLRQFRKEAKTLARLFHPNISRVFEVDCWEGQWYIAMAYVPGVRLDYKSSRPMWETLDLIRTVALALREAHEQGIIHRDIKPANVMLNDTGQPVVMDFGLAINRDEIVEKRSRRSIVGTIRYMSPEQATGKISQLGPQTDVYSLGALLFKLLTGRTTTHECNAAELITKLRSGFAIPAASDLNEKIPQSVDLICRKALAFKICDRFQSMDDFAQAIERILQNEERELPVIRQQNVCFQFMSQEHVSAQDNAAQDRLYLDAGNAVEEGVLDHHHLEGTTCTARLAWQHPELIRAAVKPWRSAAEPFTMITHTWPDLDGVASAFIALFHLRNEEIPEPLMALVDYVEKIDQGISGLNHNNLTTLYAAYMQHCHSLSQRSWDEPANCWQQMMIDGLRIFEYASRQIMDGDRVEQIDAFQTPGLFRQWDRDEVSSDLARYQQKLESPQCHAKSEMFEISDPSGERKSLPFLFVRNVQSTDDDGRCLFFKDWARSDSDRCPATNGYVGLCVSEVHSTDPSSDSPESYRIVVSLRPDSHSNLKGLGQMLEKQESKVRLEKYGSDQRNLDPKTGKPLSARIGYQSADPWYDGRAHNYTIIDSPRQGTILSPDEVEQWIRDFSTGKTPPDELDGFDECEAVE